MRIKKSVIALLIMTLVLQTLAGCGDKKDETEGIELVEPVGVAANYAVASRQDLVAYKTYGGKVVPRVTEIAFSTNQKFEKYGILPGNQAGKGDTVIYASTEEIDKKIKALKEKIASNDEAYEEAIRDIYDKTYYETEASIGYYEQIVKNIEAMSGAERQAYETKGEYTKYKGLLARSVAEVQKRQEKAKETKELYELDRDYDNLCLKQLNTERKNVLANAKESGTVVAIGVYDWGNYINKDVSVAATGDFSDLRIRCDMVYKSEIKRAVEYYAVINGEKYEVEYVEPEASETGATTTTETSNSYSTFLIKDDSGTVKAGDFATVVVVSNRREGALCIPTDAIKSDTDGAFVYLYEGDEKTSYTPIKIGIKNGFYTEVLSGLSEGDKVVSEFKVKEKSKTQAVTKGKISVQFSETGYIFYPKNEYINNTVEYGVTYITELCVKRYERVEKGQVLAKIRVAGDDINIKRNERKLQRAKEDLAELEKDKDKNEKLIKIKNETIKDLEELISDMKSDAAKTVIKAPFSGIITSVNTFEEGDILQKDQTVCTLADENNCYVVLEDKAGQITYGNTAIITYDDEDGNSAEAVGEVVMVSNCALSEALNTGYNLIKVSKEDFAKMAASNRGYDGWWMRSHFNVSVEVRSMDNVVLIPKSAVTVESGVTYVTILDENNKPTLKSFIAGGSDNFNYWVVDGLSEGTKICLE